ncbi:MAG: twin-arginine translocase TatA/TatE family subunit [Dehalococcoidia bacterium]|nr:twin-arginine translocase TatA/TatE family subunit [Dehalococcoidia bacterium]
MFGMGWMEILFILVIAMVFLGPDKVVDAGRMLGRMLGEIRRSTDEVTRTLSLDQAFLGDDQRAKAPQAPPLAPEGSQPRVEDVPPKAVPPEASEKNG